VNKELRQIDFLLESEPSRDGDEAPSKRLRRARSQFEGKSRPQKPVSRREEMEKRRKPAGGRRRQRAARKEAAAKRRG
jgi:hypothetical protein